MTRNSFKGGRDPYLSTLEYWIIRGDESSQLIAHSSLLIAHSSQLIAHSSLLIAHSSKLIAHYS